MVEPARGMCVCVCVCEVEGEGERERERERALAAGLVLISSSRAALNRADESKLEGQEWRACFERHMIRHATSERRDR